VVPGALGERSPDYIRRSLPFTTPTDLQAHAHQLIEQQPALK